MRQQLQIPCRGCLRPAKPAEATSRHASLPSPAPKLDIASKDSDMAARSTSLKQCSTGAQLKCWQDTDLPRSCADHDELGHVRSRI